MTNQTERTPRSEAFRAAIAAFIDERREAKQKGKEVDADSASKFDYHAWLADAALRASRLRAATHVLKGTHPDAQGSDVHVHPHDLPQHVEIGSHNLGPNFAQDVTGNAADQSPISLLRMSFEGTSLASFVKSCDPDLALALNPDPNIAQAWLAAFGNFVRTDRSPASHPLAKQVYWLVQKNSSTDGGFHLLQPLFASSLIHQIHWDVEDALFGKANKALRESRSHKQEASGMLKDYRGLIKRTLGGKGQKALNVSRLNCDRGGRNYLLASLPPQWQSAKGPRFQGRSTAMAVYGQMTEVKRLVHALAQFLKSDPPPNLPTRLRREGLEQALGAQLLAFVEWVEASLPVGWTRANDCTLPECEKLWLDAGRADPERHGADDAEADEAFARAYHWGDWPDQVASRFAAWLNDSLREKGVMGLDVDAHRHWAKQAVIDAAWPVPQQRRAAEVAS